MAALGTAVALTAAVSPSGSSAQVQPGAETPTSWTVSPDEVADEMKWATEADVEKARSAARLPLDLQSWSQQILAKDPTLGPLLASGAAVVVDDSYWGNGGGFYGVALYLTFEKPTTLDGSWQSYAYPPEGGEEAHAQRDVSKEPVDERGLPVTRDTGRFELADVTVLQVLVASTTESIHSVQKIA